MTRVSRLTLLPLGVLFAAFPLLFAFRSYLNHDVAFFLTAAVSLAEGRRPGIDIVDVNPPLMMYLSLVPVLLSRFSGMALLLAGQLSILALILCSAFAIARLLRLPPFGFDTGERAIVTAFWLLGSLATYVAQEFGQREQVFVLLYLPFLFLRLLRHEGGRVGALTAAVLGTAAFLGTALKPHFVATLVAVELYQLLRSRRPRVLLAPETLAWAAAAVLYAVHLLVVPGVSQYFTRWVPILARAYTAYGGDRLQIVLELLDRPGYQLGLVLVVLSSYLALRMSGALAGLLGSLSVFTACAALSFAEQAKGWTYHLIPAWFSALLLTATLLVLLGRLLAAPADAAGKGPRALAAPVVWSLATVVLVASLPISHGRRDDPGPAANPFYQALLRHTQPRDRVLFLSPATTPGFPALTLADRRPGSRYYDTFPLPLFYHDATGYRTWEETSPEERRFYRELVSDVATLRPRLVFVSTRQGPQGCPEFFSVDEYLARRGFFQEALSPYAELEPIGGFRLFRRRQP
ncbi:MAG TPA: hypothetical protein VEQ10_00605 [Vicinamibacteria bacterium]|nr:hypothetical protein [Vicinamibacteria bacterium]